MIHAVHIGLVTCLVWDDCTLENIAIFFFFSFIYSTVFDIDERCSPLIRLVRGWNFHISRGLFLARRPEGTHRCSQLVCILIDARFTEPDLYIAAMPTDELFVPRLFAHSGLSLLYPARILRRVRRERSYILHGGLITDRVIRLRCNPSVAARRACGINPLPFPTLRDLQKKKTEYCWGIIVRENQ